MKVEIETQIEVTMKMNLSEARVIRDALRIAGSRFPDSRPVYTEINSALKGREKK